MRGEWHVADGACTCWLPLFPADAPHACYAQPNLSIAFPRPSLFFTTAAAAHREHTAHATPEQARAHPHATRHRQTPRPVHAPHGPGCQSLQGERRAQVKVKQQVAQAVPGGTHTRRATFSAAAPGAGQPLRPLVGDAARVPCGTCRRNECYGQGRSTPASTRTRAAQDGQPEPSLCGAVKSVTGVRCGRGGVKGNGHERLGVTQGVCAPGCVHWAAPGVWSGTRQSRV